MPPRPAVLRFLSLLALAGLVASCGQQPAETTRAMPLGDFRLGHNIVVARTAKKVPPSRDATPEEWKRVMHAAIADRLGGLQGERLYHTGIAIDGYSLAVPGVPVVASPKSILVISANVWDDAAGKKLNDEPRQITVFESLSPETVVGTGLTRDKQAQMQNLAENAAARVADWLRENEDRWFTHPAAAGTEADAKPSEAPPAG